MSDARAEIDGLDRRIAAPDVDLEARRQEQDARGADKGAEEEEEQASEESSHDNQEPALISMTSCGAASRCPAGVTRM